MEKRFKALRLIGTVYKVLGIIVAVLGVLASLGSCAGLSLLGAGASEFDYAAGFGAVEGIIFGAAMLVYTFVMAIGLYGFGEVIYLGLAIEENTRASAQAAYSAVPAAPTAPRQPA